MLQSKLGKYSLKLAQTGGPLSLAMIATNGRMQAPKHLLHLNQVLIEASLKRKRRIIITMPPRHAKSETTSRWFPVWHLGNNARDRVALVSYAAEFAAMWGRKARDSMTEHGEKYFGMKVRENVAARDAWSVEKAYRTNRGWEWRITEGEMVTTGIGGPLTGRGYDIGIIDDPVKNAQEAFSATIRENIWEWFNSTFMTRGEPGAVVIVIMTRWHQDDLVGRLLDNANNGGEQWEVINFPALAGSNDPLGRAEGEALWPERYPAEELEQIKINRGAYWFSAMYQQEPVPVGDTLFSKDTTRRYVLEGGMYGLIQPDGTKVLYHPSVLRKFATVDLAASTKTSADWTVVSTWGLIPSTTETLLLDVRRIRLEGPDQVPLLRKVWIEQHPAAFYIESSGYQLTMIQTAKRGGLPVFPLYPDGDKIARALTASARFAAGMYYFPIQAPWLYEAEKELYNFPAAEHDDFVDTVSYSALVSAGGPFVGNLG